ncbi:CD226 antigen isoform X4 [Pungitius pungitius]|uniref:CD226 antigen isoform X4 n=1 Tax=Pungitius pungitius TaxID=134920 RepID=UPI002E104AB2
MDDSRVARFLVWTTSILSTVVEAQQVIGGNVNVVQGGTAILPCKLIDAKDPLTQIAWRKKPWEDNFILINPTIGMKFINGVDKRFEFFGDVGDYNGSLRFSNITLRDEGTYKCVFTLFPNGNVQTEILLNLLVPPVTSLEDNRPILGNEEVPLVTCKAAGSKPAAEVRWLKVSPIEVNISKKSEDAFQCLTEANPHADITWSRSDHSRLQSTVKVEGAMLRFGSMTSDLNGLYQCEASNLYGRKHSFIYVHVTSEAEGTLLETFYPTTQQTVGEETLPAKHTIIKVTAYSFSRLFTHIFLKHASYSQNSTQKSKNTHTMGKTPQYSCKIKLYIQNNVISSQNGILFSNDTHKPSNE